MTDMTNRIGSIIDLRFPKSLYDSYRDRSDETCQR